MRETERETAAALAETTPSLDLVFDLLADRRRRYALYFLYDRPDGVATIEEITDHIVALETREEGPVQQTTVGDRKQRVHVDLQHVHLPKLEDASVLEIDQRSQTVRYWSQPSLEELLEHARHKELA